MEKYIVVYNNKISNPNIRAFDTAYDVISFLADAGAYKYEIQKIFSVNEYGVTKTWKPYVDGYTLGLEEVKREYEETI